MNKDFELEIHLDRGNGDYDETEVMDINVEFECEEIQEQSDVGQRACIEIKSYTLPFEYKNNSEVIAQVDSCVAWVEDQFNDSL